MNDIDSVSSGSTSSDLGDMWRQGCPKGLECEGELELDSAEVEEDGAGVENENEGEGLEDSLKQVIESPLRVWVRDFLSSDDLLEMRTTGHDWNVARPYGSFAELWFFLMNAENDKSEPLPQCPSLTCDCRPLFGFALGIFGTKSSCSVGQWDHVVSRQNITHNTMHTAHVQ